MPTRTTAPSNRTTRFHRGLMPTSLKSRTERRLSKSFLRRPRSVGAGHSRSARVNRRLTYLPHFRSSEGTAPV
jgi:hypothetical protein